MVIQILVNIGSGSGLLPGGTKPSPKPMLTYHQRCSVAFTWEQISQEVLMNLIWNICLEITVFYYHHTSQGPMSQIISWNQMIQAWRCIYVNGLNHDWFRQWLDTSPKPYIVSINPSTTFPWRYACNFKLGIFKLISRIDTLYLEHFP